MMQAFDIHESIVQEYTGYLKSFIEIKNPRIREAVDKAFQERRFLPEGMVQFNPAYALGQSLEDLEREGVIGQGLRDIFGSYNLYHHQVEALRRGANGESFVVTSGTGSGKSLTYLATIFDSVLKAGAQAGLQAVVVYPMNALINSQEEEIKKYEINWLRAQIGDRAAAVKGATLDEEVLQLKALTSARFPVRYGKYTGQEGSAQRAEFKDDPPHILLTNYMMLELIMTRNGERWLRDAMQVGLRYLVFDELHTYRGRQGADVSMLIRRIKAHTGRPLICIGTSATMTSDGNALQRREAVAQVATQLFSQIFLPHQVVEERLRMTTVHDGPLPRDFDLQEAIGKGIDFMAESAAFLRHPLAIWLEHHVALARLDDGVLERGKPRSLQEMSGMLSEASREAAHDCERAIKDLLQWAERLNAWGAVQRPRQSFLPFKIHQFISQLGNVYVTLQSKATRHITLDMGRYVKRPEGELPIFPVLFSRLSGYDFVCVRKYEGKLVPRDSDDLPQRIRKEELKGNRQAGIAKRELTEDDFPDGYLILPEEGDEIWNEEEQENLPDGWFVQRKGQPILDSFYAQVLPRKIYFNAQGDYADAPQDGDWTEAWFVPARLYLDPTSGQVYDAHTREFNKLMRLSNEGRSTATTILSFSTIKALNAKQIPLENQKLLSFTDNRQDASLQAGHFNDFLMVARLRSAVYHALKEAKDHRLNIDELPTMVLRTLNLNEHEYAREPSQDPESPNNHNRNALKDYITVRLLYDLRRGWRNNTPNLEQCALLEIEYEGLERLCMDDEKFAELEVLNNLNPRDRKDCLVQILNFFRTSYAFQFHKLEGNALEDMLNRIRNRLDNNKLWSLDKDEDIDAPIFMVTTKVDSPKARFTTRSIGPLSAMAKFLRRLFKRHQSPTQLRGDLYVKYMERLCETLTKAGLLWRKPMLGEPRGQEPPTYRLLIGKVIWKLNLDRKVLPDEVRIASIRPIVQRANEYFRKLYQQDFGTYKRTLIGREHTGQLNHEDRSQREQDFRSGKIAALFCSPTMELGIDIHELNVVHMRNVPPNPANYAQRSGRAGRSGQAALVFTYCAQRSPHDQHYFGSSNNMVAGKVLPPKIDLCNQELIRSHFNAYILMELGLKDLVMSVKEALDMEDLPSLPLKRELYVYIENQIAAFGTAWIQQFGDVLKHIPGLSATYWYNEDWLRAQVREWLPRLSQSFERWRSMFLSANKMVERGRAIQDDTSLKSDAPKKKEALTSEREGKRRKAILLNDNNRSYGADSEFYIYRYLAAEGFLPGYGFTRLPIRTFLGNRHQDQGEFVSRPRFIALREFGPHNMVYHNGGKFVVTRMHRVTGENEYIKIRICKQSGYALMGEDGQKLYNDPITQAELSGQDAVEELYNLLPLDESSARPRERISCEEEERQSTGYKIDQYFAFSKDNKGTREVQVCEGGAPLLNIIYDQAAQLVQVNSGWKEQKEKKGFKIGSVSNSWKLASATEKTDPDDKPDVVKLYTTDTSDILYIQPLEALGLDVAGTTTLAYALKRAIERKFQIEEREIMVWVMGSGEHRNILIYEAAEGSLGILSQLAEYGNDLKAVFAEASAVLHMDPHTGADLAPQLPRATYNDLLSYYNQRDHALLDRRLVGEALSRLLGCTVEQQVGNRSLQEHYAYLLANYDPHSSTERKLLEYLYEGGYALPDRAQYILPDSYFSADFAYRTAAGYTLVLCDGSVHDDPGVKAEDERKRPYVREHYDVIEWHHSESLESLVARRKDIFRKTR